MRILIPIACLLLLVGSSQRAAAQDSTYSPSYELANGKELIAVYFGATTCGACHEAAFKSDVKRMKVLLQRHAKAAGYTFSVTGAALQWDVEAGFEFMEEVGPFDEVLVGKNWSNLAAVDYIWSDSASFPALPQIVVLKREVDTQYDRIVFSSNVLVARYVGAGAVRDWVAAGAPLCWMEEKHEPYSWVMPDCTIE